MNDEELTNLIVIKQIAGTVGTAAQAIKQLAENMENLENRLFDLQFKFRNLESLVIDQIKRDK